VPDLESLEKGPGRHLSLKLLLPSSDYAQALVDFEHAAMFIFTGSDILFAGLSEVLIKCSRNKKVFAPLQTQLVAGAPQYIWRAYKELARAVVTIHLFPRSPACQEWMTARRLDTSVHTWEEALLAKLSGLHSRMLTNKNLPTEADLSYGPWG
jgi:hypothetical protein